MMNRTTSYFIFSIVGIALVSYLINKPRVTVSFSPQLTKDVLYYSKSAYCSESAINNWNCASCGYYPGMVDAEVFYNSSHHAQGYGGYDRTNNRIVFAFRGSVDAENWISNFDFLKTSYNGCSGCSVHSGFYKTWKDLEPSIINKANQLRIKYPAAQIYVTGHSLGAAVSTICAVKFLKNI